jgi:hypothetical protein
MAILNHTEVPMIGVQFKMSIIKQAAQNDKVVFTDAGCQLFAARIMSTAGAATVTRNTVTATNGVTLTAATQSFTYYSGTANARLAGDFYVQIDDELIYVGKDTGYTTTTGLMKALVRGALGTTPATHSATSTVYIMNSFNLGDSQASLVAFTWAAYPPDPRSSKFTMV